MQVKKDSGSALEDVSQEASVHDGSAHDSSGGYSGSYASSYGQEESDSPSHVDLTSGLTHESTSRRSSSSVFDEIEPDEIETSDLTEIQTSFNGRHSDSETDYRHDAGFQEDAGSQENSNPKREASKEVDDGRDYSNTKSKAIKQGMGMKKVAAIVAGITILTAGGAGAWIYANKKSSMALDAGIPRSTEPSTFNAASPQPALPVVSNITPVTTTGAADPLTAPVSVTEVVTTTNAPVGALAVNKPVTPGLDKSTDVAAPNKTVVTVETVETVVTKDKDLQDKLDVALTKISALEEEIKALKSAKSAKATVAYTAVNARHARRHSKSKDALTDNEEVVTIASVKTKKPLEAISAVSIQTVKTDVKPDVKPKYSVIAAVAGRVVLQDASGIRYDLAVGENLSGCGALKQINPETGVAIFEQCVAH